MHKKYILLLFTFLFYVGFKSQTLYTPNIPTSGVTYNVSVKSDTTMFSQQGPWDFSSTTTTSNENIQILPISSSTIGSNYPNASHVKYLKHFIFNSISNNMYFVYSFQRSCTGLCRPVAPCQLCFSSLCKYQHKVTCFP